MDQIFQFKLPRRWRLHRRGHATKTALDTTKSNTTKSDTTKADIPLGSISDTPKSNEPRTKDQPHVDIRVETIGRDYFGFPLHEIGGNEIETKAKVATEVVPLPLEVFRSLEKAFLTAQLNQTNIKALEQELEKARRQIRMREDRAMFYYWELEGAKEELRELREKRGITPATKTVVDNELIRDTRNDRRVTELSSSDSAPTSLCSSCAFQ